MTAPAEWDRLDAIEARALTEDIKRDVTNVLPKIRRAFEGRADVALGYDSWEAYCDKEFQGLRLPLAARKEAVVELRSTGMSTRAIGAALNVPQTTVMRDIGTEPNDSVPEAPVRGLDGGREQPARRKAPKPALPPKPSRSRKPLPDLARAAGWDLRKVVERIEGIYADDRYPPNKQQVTEQTSGHLRYAIDTLSRLVDATSPEGDTT